jgi:uracil-DNA glycosylase
MIVPGSGPKPAKIMIVGEAPGRDEELSGLPFVGASGRALNQSLARVGLNRADIYMTNVVQVRPPANDIFAFCIPKVKLPPTYLYPPLAKGKYLAPEHLSCIPRLTAEIREVNPNLIIAFGNLALWALMNETSVKKWRGCVAPCTLLAGKKVLPTYHPAYILRSYEDSITFLKDLQKAAAEALFPEIVYPERQIAIDVTLEDIAAYLEQARFAELMSVDIETEDDYITSISFSHSPSYAFVILFKDLRQPDGNYWRTIEEEVAVWQLVDKLLRLPVHKIFQNGAFDLQFLFRLGLTVINSTEDPMLLHHSLYPSMEKSLGYMGSLYTRERAWKNLSPHGRQQLVKKEE